MISYPSFACEISRLIGGLDPNRTVSVVLDVGTNNEALLNDPLYLVSRFELSSIRRTNADRKRTLGLERKAYSWRCLRPICRQVELSSRFLVFINSVHVG